jgi:hypothetical protein
VKTPALTLDEARAQNRCRIFGATIGRVHGDNPLVLNYGKEYAHKLCLDRQLTIPLAP